eukprot:CFRG1931T1
MMFDTGARSQELYGDEHSKQYMESATVYRFDRGLPREVDRLAPSSDSSEDDYDPCDDIDSILETSMHDMQSVTESRCEGLSHVWKSMTKITSSDWILLLLLGTLTALLSFCMDVTSDFFLVRRTVIFQSDFFIFPGSKYFIWLLYMQGLLLVAVILTRVLSTEAIGSGIPEMKTIMRGFEIPNFLSLRTFIATVVGLALSVGSGIPIGKEGPFVHVACMVGNGLMYLPTFRNIRLNQHHFLAILSAACAVGVSCNFAAPIGGVMFSIEVTATYFAVSNYWKAFFAAVCGAFLFRLLAVFFTSEYTITAMFTTEFDRFPFDVGEMIVFVGVGVACGLLGVMFIWLHGQAVRFRSKMFERFPFLDESVVLYPAIVCFFVSTFQYPGFIGHYMGLPSKVAINHLFSSDPLANQDQWDHPNVFVCLSVFFLLNMIMTVCCVGLAIPAGVFVPVFTMGATFGRFVGELMLLWFPNGLDENDPTSTIIPGGYAIVGAAALSGSVTHTVSTSVIVFELTGQIDHILPVMIAVLVANLIAQLSVPSFYESIIQLKNLPYLPDILTSKQYKLTAQDIMERVQYFIHPNSTYGDVQKLLIESSLFSIPVVKSKESMMLVGSISRDGLVRLVDERGDDSIRRGDLSNVKQDEETPSESMSAAREASSGNVRSDTRVVEWWRIRVEPAPMQMVAESPLVKVHQSFALMTINQIYITRMGKLVGLISLGSLADSIKHPKLSSNRRRIRKSAERLAQIQRPIESQKTADELGHESDELEMKSVPSSNRSSRHTVSSPSGGQLNNSIRSNSANNLNEASGSIMGSIGNSN